MDNNKGYTIIEILILALILGILAIFSINKISYAFSIEEKEDNMAFAYKLIIKQAQLYGEKNKDLFAENKDHYLLVSDLADAKYLLWENDKKILGSEDIPNLKIKISYHVEKNKITAEVLK